MKFTKISFKLLKSADGVIKCWSENLSNNILFETNREEEPTLLENMTFFIGQTHINVAPRKTEEVIRNVRIEDSSIPKACFFSTIIFKSNKGNYI